MRKLLVGFVLPLIALAIVALGAVWWGSACSEVEQKVDNGSFQVRQIGGGWFVTAESGFSKTAEYLGRFAGLMAKRTFSDQSGREAFKLAGSCGGSTTVGYWASKKGIGPDGQKLPRLVLPKFHSDGSGGFVWSFAIGGAIVLLAVMVWPHRRRFVFAK